MPKPITKVLIANRGEIAVRVMRTCRELGIATVAVYSDLDRDALHVRFADEAYALGGQTAAESYLNTEAILARDHRVGRRRRAPRLRLLLRERRLRRAVSAAGVTWIGPPPEAIEVMGDKISSRIAAARADVESVPGTTTPITEVAEIARVRRGVRLPDRDQGRVRRRRSRYEGGARRGVGGRRVRERAAARPRPTSGVPSATWSATSPSLAMWSCRSSATRTATGICIGDRDCSTQRRHQKLVEEAPAPAISDTTRSAMYEAGVKVALACGYVGAGTIEMLYQDGEFYFLEMNTRLQVEHCVTEEVTGLDLVAWQLAIAAGGPLPFGQDAGRAARPFHRSAHQRRERRQRLPAVAGTDPHAARAFRSGCAMGRWLRGRRRDLAVLRQPRRQARGVGAHPRGRDRAHAARARRVRDQRHPHHDPRAQGAHRPPRLRRRGALDEVGRGRVRPRGVRRRRRARPRRAPTATGARSWSARCPSR